jgi:hypothetical protein
MTAAAATAEIFWTAFRALPRNERQAIVGRLLGDRQFREDLIDAATVAQRRKEPARPLGEYLARRSRRARG